MVDKTYPSVSVVIPTLNSERTLETCLKSIKNQIYTGDLEIIIADAGSTDSTIKIAREFRARVIKNRLVTGEAGKAVGSKKAKGELIGFIDSDNVLPNENWLQKIVLPFVKDREIIASEPIRFTYRHRDHWLTRYFALLGMGDPLNLFIGWYDKYCYITNKWTGLKIKIETKKDYFSFFLEKNIPTIGANGFFIRKKELNKYPIKDYLFDIDVLKALSQEKKVKVAKVKIGIIHLFSGDINTFIRKQRRRVRDYLFFKKQGLRIKDASAVKIYWGVFKFVIASVLILPLLVQTLIGYLWKKDWAWLFHPLACWLTLIVYSSETVKSLFISEQFSRRKWSQ